jgi:hypothetical protein
MTFITHGFRWTYWRIKKKLTLCKHVPCSTLTHSTNEDLLSIKCKGDPEVSYPLSYVRYHINIFSNSSHLEWRAGLSDTIFKGTNTGTIPARFGLIWFSGYNTSYLMVLKTYLSNYFKICVNRTQYCHTLLI